MASPTKHTKKRRLMNKAKMGKLRKNKIRLSGSTPKSLILDKPNANEKSQIKSR